MRNYKSLETHHDFYKGVETINHVKTASDNFVFKSKRKVRVTEEPHQPWDALSPFTCTADCPYFTRIFNWKYASRLADENLRYQITLICVESPLLNLKRSPNLVSHTGLKKHVFCRWRRSWSEWWKRIRSFEARSKWRYGCSKKEGKIHTEVQIIISFFLFRQKRENTSCQSYHWFRVVPAPNQSDPKPFRP